jgi:hypothetical protein
MAGIHFAFEDYKPLISLSIGIAQRLDESRAESFTLLYCDFSEIEKKVLDSSLQSVLRTSDSIINYGSDYFFVLPYTDKYGAEIVKKTFDNTLGKFLNSFMVSYPVDGESEEELTESLQNSVKAFCQKDLSFLD